MSTDRPSPSAKIAVTRESLGLRVSLPGIWAEGILFREDEARALYVALGAALPMGQETDAGNEARWQGLYEAARDAKIAWFKDPDSYETETAMRAVESELAMLGRRTEQPPLDDDRNKLHASGKLIASYPLVQSSSDVSLMDAAMHGDDEAERELLEPPPAKEKPHADWNIEAVISAMLCARQLVVQDYGANTPMAEELAAAVHYLEHRMADVMTDPKAGRARLVMHEALRTVETWSDEGCCAVCLSDGGHGQVCSGESDGDRYIPCPIGTIREALLQLTPQPSNPLLRPLPPDEQKVIDELAVEDAKPENAALTSDVLDLDRPMTDEELAAWQEAGCPPAKPSVCRTGLHRWVGDRCDLCGAQPPAKETPRSEHLTRARNWLQNNVGSWMWEDVYELAGMMDEAFDLGAARSR